MFIYLLFIMPDSLEQPQVEPPETPIDPTPTPEIVTVNTPIETPN